MKKKKNKFLETSQNKKHFDAFNVISVLLFFAVLVTFIVSLISVIIDLSNAADKSVYVYPLILRILVIVMTFIPLFMEKVCKINLTFTISTIYYIFLFVAIYLGSFIDMFNMKYLSYFFNGVCGFVLAFVGLIVINHFFAKKQKTIAPIILFLICSCFAVTLNVAWEIYEFVVDLLFDVNMQNYINTNGVKYVGSQALLDTMTDLFAGFVGAILSSIMSAWCYKKNPNYINAFCIQKAYNIKDEKNQQENVEDIETIE